MIISKFSKDDVFLLFYLYDKYIKTLRGKLMNQLQKAGKFINENINKVNYRFAPTFHVFSPIGWANDPNGFNYFNSKIHLFYQYYPYKSKWGPMHWGHVTSNDFIKWEQEIVALAPDQKYDQDYGAFSGSSMVKDNKLYLMYTGVSNNLQQQCLALSNDGINFEKVKLNPVISVNQIPKGFSKSDFRDPYLFKKRYYYSLIGSSDKNGGNILLYRSKDLLLWKFVGCLFKSDSIQDRFINKNDIFECPSFFQYKNQSVIICSPQRFKKDKEKFQNLHSSIYIIGSLNYKNGQFNYINYDEIDSGFDFYAPQVMRMKDKRIIMIAWMNMWNRTMITQKDHWVGSFTLPRELSIKDNHLYQLPVKELNQYCFNKVEYKDILLSSNQIKSLRRINGNTIRIDIVIDFATSRGFKIILFKGKNHQTTLSYNLSNNLLTLDRSQSGKTIIGEEENNNTRSCLVPLIDSKLQLTLILDRPSLEVFINDGYKTMSANIYPNKNDQKIAFQSIDGTAIIKSIIKYDIIVE